MTGSAHFYDIGRTGSVEASGRAPVAVQVHDHDGVAARGLARAERSGSLVRPLGENGVGLELAQLTRDAERQCSEERRAVECRQLSRQVKRAVAPASCGENAEVELGADRIPFASQARGQR